MSVISKRTIKFLTLASMLLSTAWGATSWAEPGFPWGPAIVLLGSLVTYLTLEFRSQSDLAKNSDMKLNNDAALIMELQDLLPSHDAIDFIKNHDFGGSFNLEDIQSIRRFRHEWDNAQHHFNDPELEVQRASLMRAAQYFGNAIALNTSPRLGLQSAVPEHISSDGPFPDWVRRDILQVERAAEALVAEHEKMMILARQKVPLRRN